MRQLLPSVDRLTFSAFLAVVSLAVPLFGQPAFSKQFGLSATAVDTSTTLTFTIDNASGSQATGVTFSDTLPAGMAITDPSTISNTCGGTVTAPAGGSTISLVDGAVPGNSSCQIVVDVVAGSMGTFMNVSGSLSSSLGSSGTASADLTVDNRPIFTKSFSPPAINYGDTATLTFTIGTADDRVSISFSDPLPFGLTVADPANATTTCAGTLTANPGSSMIQFSAPGFTGAGTTCTASVDVRALSAGVLVNRSGNLSSLRVVPLANQTSGFAAAALTVTADSLLLTKEFVDDPAAPGETTTLRFSITNHDRGDAATDIAFTDDLDATLTGLVATGLPASGVCGAGSSLTGTSVLTLSGGVLDPEETCTFDVTLQVPAGATDGNYPNATSSITAMRGGSPISGSPATGTLQVQTGPLLTKTITPDPATGGDNLTVTFTLSNPAATPMSSITFDDQFRAFYPGASLGSTPGSSYCNGTGSSAAIDAVGSPSLNVDATGVRFSGITLAAGASCSFDLHLNLPQRVVPGTYVNTTTRVSAQLSGNAVSGPPAVDSIVIYAAPTLTKRFTDDPVAAGDSVTLQFTLATGEVAGGTTTNIAFDDPLPAGLVPTVLPAPGFCGAGSTLTALGSTLQVSGASLAEGESCTFSVTASVPPTTDPGDYANNTSDVTAIVDGVAVSGPGAVDELNVSGLTLSKAFDNPAIPGSTTTLTFVVANESPNSTASSIAFTDNLNSTGIAGLLFDSIDASDCTGASIVGAGTSTLSFSGGTLAPLGNCSVTVSVSIPAGTAPSEGLNTTSAITGQDAALNPLSGPPATATLTVVPAISITKQFTDDPVQPGDTVTLEFAITNASSTDPISDITFTDDLDAVVSGLAAVGLPASNVCGAGSSLSGASTLTLTGGNLAAGGSCTFSVTLQVPVSASAGTSALNTTSTVSGTLDGVAVSGDPATDALRIDTLVLEKSFDSPTAAGGSPILTFTITNDSTSAAADLSFTDDLEATLTGLTATGLPMTNVCGTGSSLTGTSTLTFGGGYLDPGAVCSFAVTLAVPGDAAVGTYPNTTSQLFAGGLPSGSPATDDLVVEPAPLFSKAFAPNAIGTNQISTLTFTIDNTASSLAATGLSFTDDFPAGVVIATPANASTTCTGGTLTAASGAGTLGYSGGTVAAGATCTVQVDVTATTSGTFDNVSGDLTSSSGNSGTASATLVANDPPGFAKQFTPGSIAAGGVSTLAFTIDNSSSSRLANNLDLNDTFPAGVVVAPTPNASTTCTGGTLTAAPGSGTITYSGGSVAANASCGVQVDVTAANPGDYANVATLTSSLGTSGNATDTLVVPGTDLSVTKTDGTSTATAGATTIYTIVASNAGPRPVTDGTLQDVFPALCTNVSFTSVAAGGASGNTVAGSGDLNEAALNLPAGSSVTYTATCTISPTASGTLSNTVTIGSATVIDPFPGNNTATDDDTIGAEADLSVTKTDGATSVVAGGSTTYTIVAANAGPSFVASASLTDSFPAECTSVSFTSAASGGATGNTPGGSGDLNEMLSLPPGSSVTYSATCAIGSTATGTLSNTATLSSATTDPNPANNSATDSDTIGASADLSLTKELTAPGPFRTGDTIEFVLVARNDGPSTATGVVVTDSVPPGLAYVSNTCGATYVAPTMTWNVGTLAPGASVSCTLTTQASGAGNLNNTATLAGNESDPTPGNNAGSAAAMVEAPAVPALDGAALAALATLIAAVSLLALRGR